MTYENMKDYFLILQDKFGSPYYTEDEIALFLNRAQLDEVVALLPIDDGKLNIELNDNTISRVAPLLFHESPANMDFNGEIHKGTFELLLGHRVIRLLAVSYNDKPVKSTRYNNWYTYIQNTFKAPTATHPRMYVADDSWFIKPIDNTAAIKFMGIRYPTNMLTDGSVTCELPDFTHNDIVSRALELAGVGSRDQLLSELKQLNRV